MGDPKDLSSPARLDTPLQQEPTRRSPLGKARNIVEILVCSAVFVLGVATAVNIWIVGGQMVRGAASNRMVAGGLLLSASLAAAYGVHVLTRYHSRLRVFEWFAVCGVAAGLTLAFLGGNMGYLKREHVSNTILLSNGLFQEVVDFQLRHRRLPTREEAARFVPVKLEEFRWAESVVYEPDFGGVVITMGNVAFNGGRFALLLELDASGQPIQRRCVTIDLEPKYLPASCRTQR